MNKVSFIAPHTRRPAGGVRVINDLCTQISGEFDSSVWPSYSNKIKSGIQKNSQVASLSENSHWVLSEFQLPYLRRTSEIRKCYSVFVQNPYILFNLKRFSKSVILQNLKNAKYIFCISSDAEEIIKSLFTNAKTVRLKWSLDAPFFAEGNKIQNLLNTKRNEITFMPRKCQQIHDLLNNQNKISGYKLVPLSNLTFTDLISKLSKSKLFISLSEYEGFAAPPVEAYALGNVVVGYTGNGNEKLFDYKNFHKVEQNSYTGLINKIANVIDQGAFFDTSQYDTLIDKFSISAVTEYNLSQFRKLNFNETCIIRKNFAYPKSKPGYIFDSILTKIHQF